MSRRGTKRRTGWLDTLVAFSTSSGSQSNVSLLGPMSTVDTIGKTLTRILLHLYFYKQAPLNDGHQVVDVGIGMAAQEAFTGNILPDPDTALDEPERGWVWRDRIIVPQDASNVNNPMEVRADIRSQRKLDNGELYFIMDNNPGDGTAFTVETTGLIRALCLL